MGCIVIIAVIIILLVIVKIALKLNTAWNRSPTCLIGKTAIVTGANTGIGFYTAQDFATRGAKVILACRDITRAEKARKDIINATNNQNVFVKIVDLASLKSVRDFARDVNLTEDRLDILVNNAGIGDAAEVFTDDGLSLPMQINYFGPFLLTNLLIGLLKKSSPSRIVNVSSAAFTFAKLDAENLNTFCGGRNYSNGKLLNILFSCELARKLEGTGVVSNSLHPGIVLTEFFRNFTLRPLIDFMFSLFFKTSEEGAQTSIYVSVAKELETVSGKYYENCKVSWFPPIPKEALDLGYTRKIWEQTEELVKLVPEERQL